MDGKGPVGQTAGLLDDRYPLVDARSKPRCRLESCALAKSPSPNRAKMPLAPPKIGQAASTLFSDQRLEPQAHQRGLLFDPGQLRSIVEKRIINVKCCSHMHQDAPVMHTVQVQET